MGVTSLLIAAPRDDELNQGPLRPKVVGRVCDVCELALEADHRIANHLAMLSSYVSLRQQDLARQSDDAASACAQLAINGIRAQIDAVSRLHRSLATCAHGAGIDLGEYLRQVCAPFMSGLSGAIEVAEDLHPGCLVRSDQILPLTQIVSEVITNAIKYSHVGGEPGNVSVRCQSLAPKHLKIEIIDDGTGLPQGFDPLAARGLGFRLVRALTAQIGAQSGFKSSAAGTRFWLRMEAAAEDGEQRLRSIVNGHVELNDTNKQDP